jgi:putative ABC transport system permease protein
VNRLWTGFVGAVVEAWGEFRIHKTQVLLSLIGVGVAVTALTLVVAAGAIASQALVEQNERWGGRPATLQVSAYDPSAQTPTTADGLDAAFVAAMDRYGIDHWGRIIGGAALQVQTPTGVSFVSATGVDADYAVMHRLSLEDGTWFTDRDLDRLAPPIVISEELWVRLGSPDLRTDPTIDVVLPTGPVTAVVIGVTPATSPDGANLNAHVLGDHLSRLVVTDPLYPPQPNYEAWVGPAQADALIERLRADIASALGPQWQVDVYRTDYLAHEQGDPLLIPKIVVAGIAGLVMLLGALGLLNIALVSVRHRIREIGIRRAFGATAGRVFFAVMMESVVATFVAGVVGVLLAIVLVRNPITEGYLSLVLQDIPGFPVEAALLGLGVATGVGALAGLLPALVAVRVKVIDAIRY